MKKTLQRVSSIIGVAVVVWLGGGAVHVLMSSPSARIGILPFQIYSETKVDYLQDFIPKRLSQELKRTEQFAILEGDSVEAFIPEKDAGWFSRQELERIALQTGVHFLIFGSLTKIEEDLSIDARVFTTLEDSPAHKSFVEGEDLDQLVEELGGRISEHIIALAPPPPPPSETPLESPVVEELLEANAIPADAEPVLKDTRSHLEEPGSDLVVAAPPLVPQATAEETVTVPSGPLSSAPDQDTERTLSAREVPPSRSEGMPPSPSVTEPVSFAKRKSPQTVTQRSYRPINITSDRMEADNRNRTVDFLGNVVAKREDMVIFADRITAFYSEDGKIRKIIARGNVKINQQDRIATCLQATFFQPSQRIVLTGKPKVWQGKNIVSGGKITISLNEDKIDIDGGGKNDRVNAIIYPMGKDLQ